MPDEGEAFASLVEVLRRLRAPDGCPWDREQTLGTLKTYLIEESYEVVQAIDDGDVAELKEELGDVLMQVVFQARILQEEGRGDIAEVCRAAAAKLIRRHPHVFGDARVADSREVLRKWEGAKRQEGKGLLSGVPSSLPALLMALRVSDKVDRVGFDWPDPAGVMDKLDSEVRELKDAVASGDRAAIESEIGDVLFTVANVSRKLGIDPEEALRRMIHRFRARFAHVEARLAAEGREVEGTPMPTLDALWEEAKKNEPG
jgi:MazG family protein